MVAKGEKVNHHTVYIHKRETIHINRLLYSNLQKAEVAHQNHMSHQVSTQSPEGVVNQCLEKSYALLYIPG